MSARPPNAEERRRRARRLARPDSYAVPMRRQRLGRLMAILGALIVLSVVGTALLTSSDPAEREPLRETLFGWEFTGDLDALPPVDVVRIIDGDTLDVRAGGEQLRVRLFGVDTPERGEACAAVATERLRRLAGVRVLLLHDERLTDGGGREPRYVFTPEGISIDAQLIVEGLAAAWRRDGALRDALVGLEEGAPTPDCLPARSPSTPG